MSAVPSMTVFCGSLISCSPGLLLRYCLNDFQMILVAPIITGITFAFTIHMHWISVIRSLYFRIFSPSFLITFLSCEIAASINIHVPFVVMDYDVQFIVRDGSVWWPCTSWFHIVVTLHSWLVLTDFGTWPYQWFNPIFLALVKVWLSTYSVMSLYLLFSCQYWAFWYHVFHCLIKLFTESAFAFCFCSSIYVAWYLVCNASSCAATISLSVSPFASPLDRHRNTSSSLLRCLSILLTYSPCITLVSHCFFKDYQILTVMCWMPSFLMSLFTFDIILQPLLPF